VSVSDLGSFSRETEVLISSPYQKETTLVLNQKWSAGHFYKFRINKVLDKNITSYDVENLKSLCSYLNIETGTKNKMLARILSFLSLDMIFLK